MNNVAVLTSLLALVLIAASCSSTDRLTLEEYAEFCANGMVSARSLIEPESVTWGDLIALGQPSLTRLRSVEPPAELADLHRASIKALVLVVGVAREQPAAELANPLAFGINGLRIATQLRGAVQDLPSDVRLTLRQAECI